MGIFSVLLANDLREDRYRTRARRQARQRRRDEQVAQATARRQMTRYLKAGVVTEEDMINDMEHTEVRLRKIWAYDGAAWACGKAGRHPGLPPEEVDRRISKWRRGMQQEGRAASPSPVEELTKHDGLARKGPVDP